MAEKQNNKEGISLATKPFLSKKTLVKEKSRTPCPVIPKKLSNADTGRVQETVPGQRIKWIRSLAIKSGMQSPSPKILTACNCEVTMAMKTLQLRKTELCHQ